MELQTKTAESQVTDATTLLELIQEKPATWSKEEVLAEVKDRWGKIRIELQDKLKELRTSVDAVAEKKKFEKKLIHGIHPNRVQTAQAVNPAFEAEVRTELFKEVNEQIISGSIWNLPVIQRQGRSACQSPSATDVDPEFERSVYRTYDNEKAQAK